jgi:3-hydroxyacyl-[acyl-carrier-protein] dehydratase
MLDLVPHRPPMLLLDELVRAEGDEALATGRVREDCPFLTERGELDSLAGAELIAQASAALQAVGSSARGTASAGMLVGMRDFEVLGTAKVGSSLEVIVREGPSHAALKFMSGEVWADGVQFAKGELRLFSGTLPAPPGACACSAQMPCIHPLFPRWGKLIPGEAAAAFTLDAGFPGFAGHFPGRPILPAVVIALLAVATARAAVEGAPALHRLSHAKFSRPVFPGEGLEVRCAPKQAGGRAWSASVKTGAAVVASMAFELKEAAKVPACQPPVTPA